MGGGGDAGNAESKIEQWGWYGDGDDGGRAGHGIDRWGKRGDDFREQEEDCGTQGAGQGNGGRNY